MCMFVSDECGAEVYFTVHASANEYCRFGCFEVGTSFHHRRLLWPAVLRIYSKFFFSTLCSGTAGSVFVSVRACVCVCMCVCDPPLCASLIRPTRKHLRIRKDVSHCFPSSARRLENILFSAPSDSPEGIYIYIVWVCVCVCVSCSPQGYYLAPNEVPRYSHSPLSQEMWRAPGEQLVQCWRCRTVEERLRYLGL